MARISDLKQELKSELHRACLSQLDSLNEELAGQHIFAYALYCSGGCRNIDIAACTREGLKERSEIMSDCGEPHWYPEVNAAEWNYFNSHYNYFENIDKKIDYLYDVFYEGDPEDVSLDALDARELWDYICDFFIEVSVDVLSSMKEEGCFNTDNFEENPLLGIQFGDPDEYSVKMVEESSKKLNSEEWHKKILLGTKHLHD